jgi:hypothetical protein
MVDEAGSCGLVLHEAEGLWPKCSCPVGGFVPDASADSINSYGC